MPPFGPWPGETPGGGGGTLASIYAFGLGDSPLTDNLFAMPAGNLRFPGLDNRGPGGMNSAIEWYQNKAAIALASPPGVGLLSQAVNLSGIDGGGQGPFWWYEFNDPAWNGNPNSIAGGPWRIEQWGFSNDVTQGNGHTMFNLGERSYTTFGDVPRTFPLSASGPFSATHQISLYNRLQDLNNYLEVLNGYGFKESVILQVQGGITLQELTHWNELGSVTSAAGQGPGWFLDVDGRLGRAAYRAGTDFYKLSADPTGGWGWQLWGYDGDSPTLNLLADATPERFAFPESKVLQLPSVDTTAYPVSDVDTVRVAFDEVRGGMWISQSTSPYEPIATGVPRLTVTYHLSLPAATLYGTGVGGWAYPGTFAALTLLQIEALLPIDWRASRMTANVEQNSLSGGADVVLDMSRNGTTFGTSLFIAAGTTGKFDTGLLIPGTAPVANETFGLVASQAVQFATGTIDATVTIDVY